MKVDLRGSTYCIGFNYKNKTVVTDSPPPVYYSCCKTNLVVTTCYIKNLNDNSIVVEGKASQSIHDCHNRSVARKLALTRALSNSACPFNKQERAAIWKAYHSRKPDPFKAWWETKSDYDHAHTLKDLAEEAFNAGRMCGPRV